jgi:hypothetical protein
LGKGNPGKFGLIFGLIAIVYILGLAIFFLRNRPALPENRGDQITFTQTAQIDTLIPESTVTHTPAPASTATPIPNPIALTGSGDTIVDLDIWTSPSLLEITYKGSGNFKAHNLDSNSERINFLVFTNGSYDGILPLDFLEGQLTASFQITSNGSWELQVIPLGALRAEKIPGIISGVGNDMFILRGDGSLDLLNADASQASQTFTIYGIGITTETLVDESAPYLGTVSLSSKVRVLVVNASGLWSLDVTVK